MKRNNYTYHPLKDEDLNIATTTTSHNVTNNTLIWLDEEALNPTSLDNIMITNMFNSIADVNYKLYNNLETFLAEIGSMPKITKLIVITSGSFAENLLPELSVSLLREISSILIFCKDSTNCQYLLTECRKIMDICTDEQSLKESIENELHPSTDFLLMDRNLQPIFSLKNNNQDFNLYKQYIEILKHYPWSSNNREKMLDECIKRYRKDNAQRRKIEEFRNSYTSATAINWYTRDSFLYRLVNKALRSLDMEQINVFRPYIKDLCKQLEHLHKQNQSDTLLTVFRGHGNMPMDQFENIKENIGNLISFNGFLSTTSDYNVAVLFSGSESTEDKSVIYEIQTNYNLKNVVFADITQLSDIEDEKEFLFSLCSIFRIDGILNDEENQISKIMMSAVDEDAVNILEQMKIEIIQEEKKHFFDSINQYCRKRYIIRAFAIMFFIMILTLGVIFGINMKLKDKTSSLDNCVGLDCTTFSTTTGRHSTLKTETSASKRTEPSILTTSSKPIIPSISTYIRTNGSEAPSSEYCFPVGWESIGDEIISQGNYRSFTVDDDSNVYVTNRARQSLEKWSSSNKLIQRYFDGNFGDTPLFYHSLSQSVYFCYTWDGYSGIYRLDGDHSKPRNVLNNTMSGIGQYRIESLCDGLYVNSGGDIFVLFRVRSHVVKWTVNNPTGILVADGYGSGLTSGVAGVKNALAVDEIDNIIYLIDPIGPRILKFTNSSTTGTVIFDGTTKKEIFSDVQSTSNYGWALIADKTGNIILATTEKISLLTSDGKFNVTILKDHRAREDKTIPDSLLDAMAFDRLGNLYVLDVSHRVLKFNRTSTTCTNTNS
ncbi:unnamed protein product [Adineta steineri]|uniref:NAD(P)(+)--arginine ADP-ribosyltransferase n=3 Tax=Adineta steineri TaxID=433720 RepID=A0A813ZNC7_9BILA|nr:unnamed protein product [Adineta steineri]CAF1130590.1 unnamed protein product [Adineta steineri]